MQELQVWWDVSGHAPRCEHVVREMKFVVFPAVVLAQKNIYAAPGFFDGVRVGPGVRIDELDAVVRQCDACNPEHRDRGMQPTNC
jgi:hypothetical protein